MALPRPASSWRACSPRRRSPATLFAEMYSRPRPSPRVPDEPAAPDQVSPAGCSRAERPVGRLCGAHRTRPAPAHDRIASTIFDDVSSMTTDLAGRLIQLPHAGDVMVGATRCSAQTMNAHGPPDLEIQEPGARTGARGPRPGSPGGAGVRPPGQPEGAGPPGGLAVPSRAARGVRARRPGRRARPAGARRGRRGPLRGLRHRRHRRRRPGRAGVRGTRRGPRGRGGPAVDRRRPGPGGR
jgi:hypothetical protein